MNLCGALGHLHQDAAQTMAAILILLVVFAYWILKT